MLRQNLENGLNNADAPRAGRLGFDGVTYADVSCIKKFDPREVVELTGVQFDVSVDRAQVYK